MRASQFKIIIGVTGAVILFFPQTTLAHCPLCTAGAGLLAVGAYWVGVKAITIGVLLGAFAIAMGIWFGRIIKRQFIPFQGLIIIAFSGVFTLWPVQMLFADYFSWYVNWFGNYGDWFNRTYAVNLFWIGAILGTVIMIAAPTASRYLTKLRNGRHFIFQGMVVAFIMIIFASLIVQLI